MAHVWLIDIDWCNQARITLNLPHAQTMIESIQPPWLVEIWTVVLVILCCSSEFCFVICCPFFPYVVVSKLPLIVCRYRFFIRFQRYHTSLFLEGSANAHGCLHDTPQDLVIDGKWKEPTIRRLQETLEELCLSLVCQEFSFIYRETSSIERGSSTEEAWTHWASLVWKPSSLGILINHGKPWLMNYTSHPPKNDIIRYQNSRIQQPSGLFIRSYPVKQRVSPI